MAKTKNSRSRVIALVALAVFVVTLLIAALVQLVALAVHVERWPTRERVVVLTFDDGPDPVLTPATLDILKAKRVPAMFFVPGVTAREVPGVRHQGHDPRHIVASHSLTHARMRNLTWREQVTELRKGEVELDRALGRPEPYIVSPYVRSPRGEVRSLALIRLWLDGRVHVGWSSAYDRREHFEIKDQGERVRAYVGSVQPGDIILMHDGNAHGEQMVSDLPLIIDGLKARGYRFATLDERRDSTPKRTALAERLPQALNAIIRVGSQ